MKETFEKKGAVSEITFQTIHISITDEDTGHCHPVNYGAVYARITEERCCLSLGEQESSFYIRLS